MQSGEYDRIIRGEYARRGPDTQARPLTDDLGAAKDYYTQEAKEAITTVVDAARKAASRVGDAFKKAQSP
jgi:hypothetical protein